MPSLLFLMMALGLLWLSFAQTSTSSNWAKIVLETDFIRLIHIKTNLAQKTKLYIFPIRRVCVCVLITSGW